MIHDRIRRARLLRGMSLQELADAMGDITKQALSKFETGKDTPNSTRLLQLARVLELKPEYFFRPDTVQLGQIEFRKHTALGTKAQQAILEAALEHIERYVELENQFEAVQKFRRFSYRQQFTVANPTDAEAAAVQLRELWRLGTDAIRSMTELLEEEGIKVVELEAADSFDGLSATIGNTGDPVVILNKGKSGERCRFTLAHELGHLVMQFPAGLPNKEEEWLCHRFAGAFLYPAEQVREDFGDRRKRLEIHELKLAKHYYGLSMQAILHRLKDLDIIEAGLHRQYMMFFSKQGWRKAEPDKLPPEQSIRFASLVYRGMAESLFSHSRAAEFLQCSLDKLELSPEQVIMEDAADYHF